MLPSSDASLTREIVLPVPGRACMPAAGVHCIAARALPECPAAPSAQAARAAEPAGRPGTKPIPIALLGLEVNHVAPSTLTEFKLGENPATRVPSGEILTVVAFSVAPAKFAKFC